MIRILVFVALFSYSCDDETTKKEPPKTLCERVYDRISECIGGRVPATSSSCGGEQSEKILISDCDTVLRIVRGEEL